MTVAELIEKLKEMPQGMTVQTEGCDCIAEAVDVEIWRDTVLIARRGASSQASIPY